MTDKELKHFGGLLEEKRLEIMRDLGMLEEHSTRATTSESASGPVYSDHMPELGSDSMEREKAFLFASRDGVYFTQVEDALRRIKDGTYGVCRACGKDIPLVRLEAVPTTTICVPCKEAENKERRKSA